MKKKSETEERREGTPTRDTSMEQMDASFDFTPRIPIGRGRPKLFRSRSPNSPGTNNLKLHVDRMTDQQLEQAIETINEDPITVTIVDINGNENQIKSEIIELPNTFETNNNNNNQIRRSSRIRSNNPLVTFGNPLKHSYSQETSLGKSTSKPTGHSRTEHRTA